MRRLGELLIIIGLKLAPPQGRRYTRIGDYFKFGPQPLDGDLVLDDYEEGIVYNGRTKS